MDLHDGARQKLSAWLQSGAEPVLVLQGFTGLGKSWLARELAFEASLPVVQVTVPTGTLGQEDLLFEIAGAFEELGDYAMTARPDGDLLQGLSDALKSPKLLVIDDFQELLSSTSGHATAGLIKTLARISTLGLPGRILLVTSRAISFDPYPSSVGTITLVAPDTETAVSALDNLLETHGVPGAVPAELKQDVVTWMGRNPRALQVLAICLRSDPIEELIDAEPESWAERHQGLSGRLVERLEARMLARTLGHLDSGSNFLLQALSVYRIPFDKATFTHHRVQVGDAEGLRDKLIDYFLIENHRGWYSLQPVARLLALASLEKNTRAKLQSHEVAAKYYSRHFQSVNKSQQLKHGKEFVEARFHLIACGKEEAFQRIASGMRHRLLDSLQDRESLPSGERERNELLATLASALHDTDGGHGRLRYLLARLLLDRGVLADRVVALNQLRQCVLAEPLQEHWTLYIQLAGLVEGPNAVVRATTRAVTSLGTAASQQIYIVAAKTLAELGQLEQAADLAAKGVVRFDANESIPLAQLYAGLLLRRDDYRGARTFTLRRLADVAASNTNFHKAFESVLFPALARRDTSTIDRLRSTLPLGPAFDDKRLVCDAALLQCENRYQDSAELLDASDYAYTAVGTQCAFSWLATGDVGKAVSAASRHGLGKNAASDWLIGLLALREGRAELAAASMSSSLGRGLSESEIADPNLWLRVWDIVPRAPRVYPAYFFPRLPRPITGLAYDLVRLEQQASALPDKLLLALPHVLGEGGEEVGVGRSREGETGPFVRVSIVNQIAPNVGSIQMAKEQVRGDKYETGVAGVVGKNASASNFEVHGTQQGADGASGELVQLAAELRTLREALAPGAEDAAERADVQLLEAAEAAATQGDAEAATSHLKQLSKWALGAATAVGTTVAAAAIKAAAGI
ncbi:AAA family ATPase [uncultured Serinicoccus sp.]|uniref:AAA family ATPase n=1 Tax=uncultured Serinicoccus sp. TaxID=735514 RepID=UPI002604A522|nr:AAA family ATPase [uncultured Serinicoccus sp.]